MLVKGFGEYCDSGPLTMKLRLLVHVVEDFERFGLLAVLDTSSIKHSYVHVRNNFWRTARPHPTAVIKMVSAMEGDEKT